jgi:hypothetical protein
MTSRAECLQADEVEKTSLLMQVVDEREFALRVPLRDEILQERDLHLSSIEEHPAMPTESRLPFEERCADIVDGLSALEQR